MDFYIISNNIVDNRHVFSVCYAYSILFCTLNKIIDHFSAPFALSDIISPDVLEILLKIGGYQHEKILRLDFMSYDDILLL